MISSTFFFLFSQLGVGMMLTLLFISPRSIGNSFFKFASQTAAVLLPTLALRRLDRFLALVPSHPCPAIEDLAARCVVAFDCFRRPPAPAELARRRAAGLDPAEESHLLRWGYPYVLDRFRFHVTLTGPLEPVEAERLMPPLTRLFEPATKEPVAIADIALFHEPGAGAPFALIERFPLQGSSATAGEKDRVGGRHQARA